MSTSARDASASRLSLPAWPRPLLFAGVAVLILNVVVNTVWVADAYDGLKDLDSFLHSGAAFAKGLNPYEYYWWLHQKPISPEALNLNPPVSVYLFEPLSAMDRGVVGAAFMIGSIAMVLASVALLMRAYPEKRHWLIPLVVASMAGVWQLLYYQQIYAPLLLAMTGAWLLMRRGDWLMAGVLIGLIIAVKPNYGLVALVLLAAGYYRLSFASLATAGAVSLVPLLLDGPQIYTQWLHLTESFDGYGWTSNASLVSVGERVGFVPAGQLAAGLIALSVLLLARRWRPDTMTSTALGTLAVVLVGPVSWAGYTLLLLPYLFSLRWDGWTWASLALLAMPFAPGPAISSLGIDVSGGGVSSGIAQGLIASPMLTAFVAVGAPIVGAVYAWAVQILFVRLCLRLAAEHGEQIAMPRFRERRRRVVGTPARRAPAALKPPGRDRAPGAAVAVRVRSEP